MKTSKISFLLTLIVLFSSFVSSCDDEKAPVKNDPAKKAKVDKVLAFREEMDFINRFVENNVGTSPEAGRSKSILARLQESAPCAEGIEEQMEDGSIKVTADFGEGCQTEDGIEVAGKVVMIFNFTETAFDYSLEFTSYSEITGENQGEVINGTVTGTFSFDLESLTQEMEQDLTVTYADNSEAIFKIAQKSEMTETGLRIVELKTSGNFADEGAFTMTVTKALVYDFNCESELPVQGEEILVFQGNTIRVNYGNGTCDESYTVN